MTIETDNTTTQSTTPPPRGPSRRMKFAGVALAILVIGAAGGAAANRFVQPRQAVLLLQPAPIAQAKDDMPVAIKGQVAELFGNRFIVQDDSGRALVDIGPRAKPVAKGDAVTVQGRFDKGFIRAQVMTRADGTTEAFGPPKPHHGPGGPHGDRGPGGPKMGPGNGPGPGPDRAPPPPPPAN